MIILLRRSLRLLASVPHRQRFERVHSRDQLTFKTRDLAADDLAYHLSSFPFAMGSRLS